MANLTERMRLLVQSHLRDIEPYDPSYAAVSVNLSANENTHPAPATVRAEIAAELVRTPLNRYPDPLCAELRAELGAWHGVAPDQVCVGNGGDELLYNFVFAFGGEGRSLLDCPPSFSEYGLFAQITRTDVMSARRDPASLRPLPDVVLEAADLVDIAVLTSPNNPTGDVCDLALIEEVCRRCRGIVMVDEAYAEFAAPGSSAVSLLDSHPNLVILRTLSKAFGQAGARCGYVIAAPEVIDVFRAVRQIYSVNVLTQAVASATVRMRGAYRQVTQSIIAERERLFRAIVALGERRAISVWPSQANFLLVQAAGASRLRERLRDEFGILVRDMSDTEGLVDCLRITVGTSAEDDAVLGALEALVEKED